MTPKITAIISGGTLLIGVVVGYFIFSPGKPAVKSPATVKTISGAPMTITKENYSGSNVKIDVSASGQGESEISIPKQNIPEVWNWMHRTHSLEADYYMIWSGGRMMTAYGASYYYRWSRLEFGGGPIFGKDIYGFRAGIKYIF